jgi:hypothetical protein
MQFTQQDCYCDADAALGMTDFAYPKQFLNSQREIHTRLLSKKPQNKWLTSKTARTRR